MKSGLPSCTRQPPSSKDGGISPGGRGRSSRLIAVSPLRMVQGEKKVTAVLKPGGFFGEVALITHGSYRAADCVARGTTKVCTIFTTSAPSNGRLGLLLCTQTVAYPGCTQCHAWAQGMCPFSCNLRLQLHDRVTQAAGPGHGVGGSAKANVGDCESRHTGGCGQECYG